MSNNKSDRFRRALLEQYELMKNRDFCDFRIIVEGCEFAVHKMILASRSPYFRTLFSCTMTESEENLLRLDDIELDIFHKLLDYIYTCDLDAVSNDDALKLIMHGEKYGLVDLLELCEAHLLKNINIEIATRCYLAGNLLERKELKSRALSLLRRNWGVVFTTEGWDDVTRNHPLMTEIEKIECLGRKTLEAPVGRMSVRQPSSAEIKWFIPISLFDRSRRSVESQVFSLSEEEEDLSWRFCISYPNLIGPYTVLLSHFGPPVVTPLRYTFAVTRNVMGLGIKTELCTGSIDTSCCFLQNSTCRTILTTFSMENTYSDRDFIYVTLKKCVENPAETSSLDYLSEYLENSCFTDAIINVGGEEFSVHKIILSAASPIFLDTFRNQGSFFYLPDPEMDPVTFRSLLLIIYQCQKLPDPLNFDLLKAVKRYKLSHKQINRCKAAVFRAMKDNHLIEFLLQAHAQQDSVLMRMAFKHMADNFEDVVQMGEWSRMSSELHDEFFKFVVSSKQPSE